MRAVIQRVTKASVSIEGKLIAEIGKGMLVLVGVMQNDTSADARQLAHKIANLRIFADKQNKMNLSISQARGEILVISQFTLCADLAHGRRPSFEKAAAPKKAEELYQEFITQLKSVAARIKQGKFGGYMQVELVNDGPVSFVLLS